MTSAPRTDRVLSRAPLTPRQAAAVIALLGQTVEAERLTTLRPLHAADFEVDANGELVLKGQWPAPRQPAADVLVALLSELTAQVDATARGASLLRVAASRTNGRTAFRDVPHLRVWAEQTFDVEEPRAVLRTIEWPAAELPPTPTASPTRMWRRFAVALAIAVLAIGAVAIGAVAWRGLLQDRADTWADHASGPVEPTSAPPPPEAPAGPASGPNPRQRLDEAPTPDGGDRDVVPPVSPSSPIPIESKPAASVAPENVAQTSLRVDVPDVDGAVFSPSFGDGGTTMFFHTRNDVGTRLIEAAVGEDDELVGLSIVSDDRARNYHLRLAPDGHRVAFDSDRDGERAVYIANRDGTGVRKVSGDGYAAVPSWSPDGSTLAFVRAEEGRPRVWNLWLAELETGRLTRLTGHRFGQTWGASWFPDGTRVAYSHETTLRIVDLGTGAVREFSSPLRGRLLRTPAVSPDGRRVVFQVHGDGAWLLTLEDGAMRRILDDPSAEEFTWHPSGGRFAYHSRRDGQWRIWITALPGPPTS